VNEQYVDLIQRFSGVRNFSLAHPMHHASCNLGCMDIGMDDVRLDDRFVGTAYGVLDDESKEALETMARLYDIGISS
jgi:1-aminocyclopropane-1-carboxylate deaminase/D-cysteine desulfhydrase-like pyridoxal-dependent ACC family enzyme